MLPAKARSAASYVSKNVFDGTRPLTAAHAARLHDISARYTQEVASKKGPPSPKKGTRKSRRTG
jgi:hypothetical protein